MRIEDNFSLFWNVAAWIIIRQGSPTECDAVFLRNPLEVIWCETSFVNFAARLHCKRPHHTDQFTFNNSFYQSYRSRIRFKCRYTSNHSRFDCGRLPRHSILLRIPHHSSVISCPYSSSASRSANPGGKEASVFSPAKSTPVSKSMTVMPNATARVSSVLRGGIVFPLSRSDR